MKKLKFLVACLVSLVILSSVALAAIPSGTVVIGDKAFDLNYANDPANYDEIRDAIVNSNGQVYVKKFSGAWINNSTNGSVQPSEIPAVTYKDADGNSKNFDAGDGDEIPDDIVAPVITITGVEDGKAYNKAVTPVVTLDEEGTIEMTLNGDEYDGSEITEDGSYTLVVTATDLTGNKSTKTITFTIKTTAPEAPVVAGVEDGKVYKTVTPIFDGTATLNDEPFESGTAVNAEGDYTLVVTIEDEAGNKASTTINFKIDKTAPSIVLGKVKDYKTLEVVFSEPVQGTPSVTVNGSSTGFTAALSEDKLSLLITSASGFAANTYAVMVNNLTDLAGNALPLNAITLIEKQASKISSVEFTSTGFKAGDNQTVYFTAVDQYGAVSTNYASISFSASIGSYPLSAPVNNGDGTITIQPDSAISNGVVITITAKVGTKVVGTANINVTNQAATPTTLKSLDWTTAPTLQPGQTGTLKLVVYDQYNRPMDLANGKVRWVSSDGSKAQFGAAAVADDDEEITVSFIASGSVTVTAFITDNISLNMSKTFTIGQLPLSSLSVATTSYNGYNREVIKTTAVTANAGAVLTADMLKVNVDAGNAADISISTTVETNQIKFSVTTTKAGTYKFTPYVGTSFTDSKAVKGPQITITTTLNPTVTSIDDITFDSKELKVGTTITKNLVFKNKHGENINGVIDLNTIVLTTVPPDKLTAGNKSRNAQNVISFDISANAAGTYQLTVAYGTEYDTYNLTFVAPVFSSIKAVDNITSGVVAGDPDSKAKFGDLVFYDQDGVAMPVQRTDLEVAVAKDGVAISDPTKLIKIGAVTKNSNGVITSLDDTAANINGYKVLADASLVPGTYMVTINKKGAAAVKITFNVVVSEKRFVNSIAVTSVIPKMTLGSNQLVTIEVRDQYNELIDAVGGTITASLSAADLIDSNITVTKDGSNVGKYKATITALTGKKGSTNLTFKTKKEAGKNDEISTTVGITVGSVGDLVDTIQITGDTKLKSSKDVAGSVQLAVVAKDASGGLVAIEYKDPTYVIWSATAKAANGSAITTGFSVDSDGLVTFNQNFVGTITVTAITSNFKTATFDVKVDNAAPVADKSTLALKDGTKVVTSITMKKTDANKTITLYAKDQYGADYTGFAADINDIIVMSADTTIVTATKNADATITIDPIAKGTTKVYVQYKGTNLILDVNITD